MMKLFLLILLLPFVLAACQQGTAGCTKELKICPDGTGVGRVPPDCEFTPCPDIVACPQDAKLCLDGSYVGREGPDCEFALCPELNDTGSKNIQKRYVADKDTCPVIRFFCAEGEPFFDDEGCGCLEELPEGGVFCQPWERESEDEPKACTLQYNPVCGWFGENIQCIKYPCAITDGNKCQACANADVKYVTSGECPV